MKNIKHLIFIISSLILGFTTGCSDYLDKMPDDQLTLEMIFEDKTRTEDWLAGVYSGMPDPLWGYFTREGWNVMGDDMTMPAEWQPFGWKNSYVYTQANWNSLSGWSPAYWIEYPKRIRSALIFIENVKPNETQGMTSEYATRMKYEARFLIAYYYSLMLEIYGPFPFKPGVIEEVDAPASELMIPQIPYDQIVDWVDAEFVEVAKHLPAVYEETSDWGRATAAMCYAARARMLLFAASPLFNGNPDFKDWKNGNGDNLFKPDADPTKWKRAANAHKELIDLAHGNGYELYKEYNTDGSIDPFMSYYNLSLKRFSEGNTEIIIGRTYQQTGGFYLDMKRFQAHHLPLGIKGNGGLGVTQELVDAFYMKDGTSPILGYDVNNKPIINPLSSYTESGFSVVDDFRNTKWRGAYGTDKKEGRVTFKDTYNMYVNREPRFYVSVIYNEAWLGVANRKVNFLQGGPDTAKSFDAPQNGYNVRKRINLETNPQNDKHIYQPGIIYRLAEAYLSYAEALNECDPGNSDILKYINEVRERAGIPKVISGTQDEIRELIKKERRIEFNCEGIRFNDIRRWKIGATELNRPYYGMNFSGTVKSDDSNNPEAYYVRKLCRTRKFDNKMYIWPVPQAQIEINHLLRQAPGY